MARREGPWRATPSVVVTLILLGLAPAPAPADDDARLVLDLRGTRARLPGGRDLFDDSVSQLGLDVQLTDVKRYSGDRTATRQGAQIQYDEPEVFTLKVLAADRPGGYAAGETVFRRE